MYTWNCIYACSGVLIIWYYALIFHNLSMFVISSNRGYWWFFSLSFKNFKNHVTFHVLTCFFWEVIFQSQYCHYIITTLTIISIIIITATTTTTTNNNNTSNTTCWCLKHSLYPNYFIGSSWSHGGVIWDRDLQSQFICV